MQLRRNDGSRSQKTPGRTARTPDRGGKLVMIAANSAHPLRDSLIRTVFRQNATRTGCRLKVRWNQKGAVGSHKRLRVGFSSHGRRIPNMTEELNEISLTQIRGEIDPR